jgi:hypothetical protein
VEQSSLLDELFLLPEVTILVQIFLIDGHLNNFSLRLQLFKHIEVNETPVVNISKELIHLSGFPIPEQHSIL